MRRASFWGMTVTVLILFSAANSQAITIGFHSISHEVPVGSTVDVELFISGLEDYLPESLSTFDLDVSFEPTILAFSSVAFGDPVLSDQLDLFGLGSITSFDDTVFGVVNLFELSLDPPTDLDSLQAGSFTIATLTFKTLGVGTSSLDIIDIWALGDANGNPILWSAGDIKSGSISSVPEPASVLLLASGLAGMGYFSKKKRLFRS
jgi:hypothetical protein